MAIRLALYPCVACRYWQEVANDNGECRKSPPQLLVREDRYNGGTKFHYGWPKTKGDDGCGEWAGNEE